MRFCTTPRRGANNRAMYTLSVRGPPRHRHRRRRVRRERHNGNRFSARARRTPPSTVLLAPQARLTTSYDDRGKSDVERSQEHCHQVHCPLRILFLLSPKPRQKCSHFFPRQCPHSTEVLVSFVLCVACGSTFAPSKPSSHSPPLLVWVHVAQLIYVFPFGCHCVAYPHESIDVLLKQTRRWILNNEFA